jgi:hypothetical protein
MGRFLMLAGNAAPLAVQKIFCFESTGGEAFKKVP